MTHVNNNQDPRGNERHPAFTEDIEKQKNITGDLDKLGKGINVEAQTSEDVKDKIAQVVVEAKDNPKKQEDLEAQGFEVLPLAVFSDFPDLVNKDGKLIETSSFAAQYIKNFGIDDPNYEVAIGEYGDDYTVYLKKNNS